jgi:hypothetical protein
VMLKAALGIENVEATYRAHGRRFPRTSGYRCLTCIVRTIPNIGDASCGARRTRVPSLGLSARASTRPMMNAVTSGPGRMMLKQTSKQVRMAAAHVVPFVIPLRI